MSARNVEQEFDALKSDFGKLSSDLVGLTEAVRDLVGQDVQGYVAKARVVAGQVNEEVDAATTALAAQGRAGVACVTHQMRDHPVASILVCLGLGFVIGKLIER